MWAGERSAVQWHPDEFEQARQARDPHFDGRVFIGVLSTGIYCRPICPVRIPRKENIRLYASAAAAAEAGFRPCLRCRPESAPGTPAWIGSSHTVSRALQLIARGVLDEGGVPALAAALDIGERQLSRLFQQHLGVSVLAVANTQRLHFAKKLIDETQLPMASICFAAGFSSVRRFNAVFQQVYGRAPSSLRKGADTNALTAPAHSDITLRLSYRPPFDWRAMLDYLRMRAIPGVEHVTQDCYSRTIMLNGDATEFHVQFLEGSHQALLRLHSSQIRALAQVVERVKVMFDLKAVSSEIEAHLSADPRLQAALAAHPGIRVPVAWDGFEVAVRAIIGQQVSVKGATTLVSRLAAACGPAYVSAGNAALTRVFPQPEVLAQAELSGLGITTRRIVAIQQLARTVLDGELRFDGSMDTPAFVARVQQIPGIGPWTAQYIALRALNDADAFPHSDLILLRAAALPGETLSPAALLTLAERWRPWRAYAVLLLWRHYAHSLTN
jgi:AraC family transcriptional regulator of adaptative response / DNA-3-methyladenine glycosylase II